MREDQRKLIRAIVRQVHPDLFTAHPFERSKNAESLKSLNVYADQVSKGLVADRTRLEFYVRRGEGSFAPVTAELLGSGSLAPLFLAFGLITAEEAFLEAATSGDDGRDLFQWLSGVAEEAALAADQHDALKRQVRMLRSQLEDTYGFASVDVGGEFSLGSDAQRRQHDALCVLFEVLEAMQSSTATFDVFAAFQGLTARLYHPDSTPLVTVGFQDAEGTFNLRSEPMKSHVSDTGILHIVADRSLLATGIKALDLRRARLLATVNSYWVRRSRELAEALKQLLSVENVWFDARSENAAQRFVLWVGAVLEKREDVAVALGEGRKFAFSLLVHSDEASPLLDYIESSSVMQIRTDCPPKHLIAFMASEAANLAHETATLAAGSREEEAAALEAVRSALGAKHVVRVCSSYDQAKVLDAAARLVEAAPLIRSSVDLSGVSLAIDDCYDVWDSGFVSIPFDFSLTELKPKLLALLAPPSAASTSLKKNGAVKNSTTVAKAAAVDLTRQRYLSPLRPFIVLPARRRPSPILLRSAAPLQRPSLASLFRI